MYNVVRQQHVYTVLWCIKEVDRMRKIAVGVSLVGEVYPGSVILRVVVGVMRGNGTTIIRPLVRLICGEYKPDNELLAPGRSTQVTQTLDTQTNPNTLHTAVCPGGSGMDPHTGLVPLQLRLHRGCLHLHLLQTG